MSLKSKILFGGYFSAIFSLFLYSFTQVDLSLTLSQTSFWQGIQQSFQYIGYFSRPLSAFLFVSILIVLFCFYFIFLKLTLLKKISRKQLWFVIVITAAILTFSYNAFSYDLFNYIFDAKIVTHYNQNPYMFKALDFPGDPMLSFMHSTHRVYPYGPVWIAMTTPLSFLGLGFFLPTFFIFKIFIASAYLGTSYFIGQILKKFTTENELLGVVIFALNPLVLVESLVSAHNDIVMVFLAVFALYLIFKKNYIISFILLFLSIGIKFSTVILLPVFLYILFKKLKAIRINYYFIFITIFILMVFAVLITSFASGPNKNPEIQPWYLLFLIPFASFVQKRVVIIMVLSIPFFIMLSYLPFILFGEWPDNIVGLKNLLLFLSVIVAGFIILATKNIKTHKI